ncbi:hypothetical protein A2U01_0056727, partial [Trifolium medium]|nr:hypothetical protein [Trifolium medium]
MGDDDQDWQTVRRRHRQDNNRFGAKALFNAFHYYGDIMEVVIPAKRDKGGRRFGFARFDRVNDPRQFEYELDNII